MEAWWEPYETEQVAKATGLKKSSRRLDGAGLLMEAVEPDVE
jgi:hypothetical protein